MSRGSNLHSEMGWFGNYKTKYSPFGKTRRSKANVKEKEKLTPQLILKSTMAKKIDLTIKEAVEDMKRTPWRSMQGIKDEQLLVSVFSRVVAKELSLEEMVTKFNK